ncbi:MAG: CDP-alcohol phosphatidyltransferase family protein [Planctomycetota bacterium]|nr:CDP-alcohol phosphatidyltransferase family protein [Planctomycetota bacterium]
MFSFRQPAHRLAGTALPVFIVAFFEESVAGYAIALGATVFFEATDWFDGFVARMTDSVSDLGKLLDPLCDTLSRFTIFLTFLAAGIAPLWMIICLFYRDMMVAYSCRVGAAKRRSDECP